MRESRIATYRPGFKAPFYPWLQIIGILISFWLIVEMGILAIAFTGMVTIACILWYQFYASGSLERRGAIFHIHERLGQQRYEGLERELMTIIHERTEAENLSYEALIARSVVMDFRYGLYGLEQLHSIMAEKSSESFELDSDVFPTLFREETLHLHPLSEGVHIAYQTSDALTQPELFVFRFGPQAKIEIGSARRVHTIMFLAVPKKPAGLDLRLAGHLAEVVQSDHFDMRWLSAQSERELNEILMRDDHFLHGPVDHFPGLIGQVGLKVAEIKLPSSCLLTLIERDGQIIVATPDTQLLENDEVAIIGEPDQLLLLRQKQPHETGGAA